MTPPISLMEKIRDLLQAAAPIMTWPTLALIVLAVINLKNLPLAWHVRILHHIWWNLRRKPQDPHISGKPTGKATHPVFSPYTITSRTPMLETDYNFHKSNSTYFSDLDISRTGLVTRIYTPGISIVSKELDDEALAASRKAGTQAPAPGSMYIALGSVYCGFKREIKPFERYVVESRVIGWDRKWLYVLSFFLRPGGRTLFASAVSKYVVKKGRLTVLPERVLRASGFLPGRDGDVVDGGDIPETVLEAEVRANVGLWDGREWTWERIEEERLRGLKVVEGYVDIEDRLHAEWER
ncbi:hypothetical protein BDV28DRAFT_157976 [Aspergillus coremiiformis]|uniref:Thioesterase-like superfamily-domain-containing protein n=1 Tax=Aspergillus coremiiformis TaxID=138285 RepID=A0A5N6Z3S8_9EURO|nr:hypothetical protein BDV28DRAFT_157976 [Aspergillus coremiiformis]